MGSRAKLIRLNYIPWGKTQDRKGENPTVYNRTILRECEREGKHNTRVDRTGQNRPEESRTRLFTVKLQYRYKGS